MANSVDSAITQISNIELLFLGDMSVFDVGLGKVLMIQNIFRYVGQCNIDGCYMIKGVMGRNMNDGRYNIFRQTVDKQ